MKKTPISSVFLFSCLCALAGCGKDGSPRLRTDQKVLVQVYVDLLEIQETLPPSEPAYLDSSRNIFARHHLSQSEYERIVEKLNQKPEDWELFYKEVLREIDRRETSGSQTEE
ncbi:MAG TPA: hypothetical protein ENN17_03740 [bacterium]|nr:hypothetical protein [bacterium]